MAPKATGEIVGRQAELEAAFAFLDSVEEGPAAFLIEGEAGIGKTSIWSRSLDAARERGFHVLVSRPAEAETQLAFSALVDLLGDVADEALDELPRPQRRALEVALLRREAAKGRADPRAVSTATLGVLRGLAATGPILLAVDDLHWVDSASDRVMRFVLRRLESERIGLIATRRILRDTSALRFDLTPPTGRVERIQVESLSLDAIGSVLLTHGTRLSRLTLRKLYKTSGGNPFFALEIARALDRRGSTTPVRVLVPDSLHGLVRDRLEALAPATQRALFAAAALSHPTVEHVSQALGGAATAFNALERAAEAQVIDLEDGSIAFTHPLLASAIYESRSPSQKRRLHRALADVVSDPEERGRHLALATARPNAEIASIVQKAADRARSRGAPDEAAELYEQARRLTPAASASARYRRTMEIADARLQAGDVRAARVAFAEAAEEARDRHARARALTRLGEMLVLDPHANLSAALETYERAVGEAAGDPSLIAAVEVDLAWLWHFRDNATRSLVHARRAVELVSEIDDEAQVAHALATAATMEGRRGNERAWTLLERASLLEVRDEPFAGRPKSVRAHFLLGEGRFEEARSIALAGYRHALERGDENSLLTLLEQLTIIERRAGRLDEAESYAREMYAAAEGGGFMPFYHSAPYALVLALRGRAAEARALAEAHVAAADAVGVGPIFGGHRSVLGFTALSLGDARACIEHLEPLSSSLTSEIDDAGWFRFLADEVEARVAVGDLEQAGILVERLAERRSVLFDRAWAHAATERCAGLVFAAAGEEAKAGEAFARALAHHERLPEPFELARTLLAQGRAERRFKRRRAAREALTRARELFAGLGAPLWVERTDEELSRIGGRSPRGAGLTATEEKVARLTATGLTNRQIAAELFITENTVETNLKRIYRELGVRSRTELAGKLLVSRD